MAVTSSIQFLERLRVCVRSFPGTEADGATNAAATDAAQPEVQTIHTWYADASACVAEYAALPADGPGLRAQALYAILTANLVNVGIVAQLAPPPELAAPGCCIVRAPIQALPRTRVPPAAVAAAARTLAGAADATGFTPSARAGVILRTISILLPSLCAASTDVRVCDKHLHELWAGCLQLQQWAESSLTSSVDATLTRLRGVCVRRLAPALLQLLWNRTYACCVVVAGPVCDAMPTPRVMRLAAAVELSRLVCNHSHATACDTHTPCMNGVEALLDAVFDAINVEDANAVDRMCLHAATILCKPPLEMLSSSDAYMMHVVPQLRRLFRLRGARADVFQRVAAQTIVFMLAEASKSETALNVSATIRRLFAPLFTPDAATDATRLPDAALRALSAALSAPSTAAATPDPVTSLHHTKRLIQVIGDNDASDELTTPIVEDELQATLRAGVLIHADIDTIMECVECAHRSLCGRPVPLAVATHLLLLVPALCSLSTMLASHGALFQSTAQACDEVCAAVLRHADTEAAASLVLRMCSLPVTASALAQREPDTYDLRAAVFAVISDSRCVYAVTLDERAAAAVAAVCRLDAPHSLDARTLPARNVLASLMSVAETSHGSDDASSKPVLPRIVLSSLATDAHTVARITSILSIARAVTRSGARSLPAFVVVQLLLAYTQTRVREWRRGDADAVADDEGTPAARLFLSLVTALGTDVLRESLDALRVLRAVLHMLTAAACTSIPSPAESGLSAAQPRAVEIHNSAVRSTESRVDVSARVRAGPVQDDDCVDVLIIVLSLITACTLGYSLDQSPDVEMNHEYVAYLKSMLPLLCALGSSSSCDAHVVEMATAVRGLIVTLPPARAAAASKPASEDSTTDADSLRAGVAAQVKASTLIAAAAQAFELLNVNEPALQAGGLLHLARVVVHAAWRDAPEDSVRVRGATYDCAVAQLKNSDVAVTNAAIAALAATVASQPDVYLPRFLGVYDGAESRVRARGGEALTRVIDGLAKANLLHAHLPALLQVCTRHGARAWRVQQDAAASVSGEGSYDAALHLQDVCDVRQSAIACTGTLLVGAGAALRGVVYDATDGLLGVLRHETAAAAQEQASTLPSDVQQVIITTVVRVRRAAACSLAMLARADAEARVSFVADSSDVALRVSEVLLRLVNDEQDAIVRQHMLDALAYMEDGLQRVTSDPASNAASITTRTGMVDARSLLHASSSMLSAAASGLSVAAEVPLSISATETRYLKH